jgi:hypothetical protein
LINVTGCNCRAFGQFADFIGYNGKSAPGFTGPRGFNGGI